MQLIGFAALSVFLGATGGFSRGYAPGWHPWMLAVFAGALNTIGSLALYYSFEVGVLTIVAPISSSYPAITVVLAFLSGERIRCSCCRRNWAYLVGLILAATSFSVPSRNRCRSQQKNSRMHLSSGRGVGDCLNGLFRRDVLVSGFSRVARGGRRFIGVGYPFCKCVPAPCWRGAIPSARENSGEKRMVAPCIMGILTRLRMSPTMLALQRRPCLHRHDRWLRSTEQSPSSVVPIPSRAPGAHAMARHRSYFCGHHTGESLGISSDRLSWCRQGRKSLIH